jgi:4-amino-4-deoxy-L-arabinose transferase-like glycosyltransferase
MRPSFPSAIRHPPSAIALVFLFLLLASWRRWTSLIADSGREMDLPRRLLEGEWLYRDVHYLYPPLSPHLNALLYRLFGAHLDVLQASGVICAALIIALCYRIAQRILPPAEAAAATIAVIVVCVFKPAGNLISPYAFAALHGTILALGALLVTLRYAENRRRRELLLAGILIGLAAVTKQEFALAAAVTLAAALLYLHRANIKPLIAGLSLAAAPALAIALPVYALLMRRIGWETLVEDCHLFYTHLPASLALYNSQRTGLDHPLSSLLQMLGAAAVSAALVSAIIGLSVLSAGWKRGGGLSSEARRMLRWAGLVFALAVPGALLLGWAAQGRWDGSPLRALPLLLLGLMVIAWRRAAADARHSSAATVSPTISPSLFIIAVYSLAVLARVALRVPSGGAFGGFFLPTALILIYYLMARALPQAIGDWARDADAARRARALSQALIAATLLVTATVFAARYRTNYSFEIRAPRGHLFATQFVGRAASAALAFIADHTAPGEEIAVLPEGTDLAFLSNRRAELRHQILIPGLMSARDEQAAIAHLRTARVRYLLIVNRPMREFGAEAFGRDYYQALGEWIDEHYQLVKVCGPEREAGLEIGDPRFFIKILARKD